MSGIAGIYNTDGGPVEGGVLRRMTDVVAHRGPDGSGHWVQGPVGFGHRLLHATPESVQEKQPLTDESGEIVLMLDGRIDNCEDLHKALEAEGATIRNGTDAELVLKAYKCWGEGYPGRLLGDFAIAIWDARKRSLFCVRDPIGIKPFYYRFDGRKFVWASEVKQIFQDPEITVEPNLTQVGRQLMGDYSEREETLYRGIFRLKPAHSLTVGPEGIKTRRYWDVDPGNQIRYRSDSDYDEHFLDLFRQSLKSCLRTGGPLGAFLSGGLDSSSIVCTARELYREDEVEDRGFETYSMVFDTLPCDESHYIEAVIRKSGFPANYIHFEQEEAVKDLEPFRRHPDIKYSPLILATMPALSDAKRKGIKVLLSGLGGDEFLASGFHHLTDLLLQGRLVALTRQLNSDSTQFSVPKSHLFRDFCLKPLFPRFLRDRLRPVARRLGWAWGQIPHWIDADFRLRFGLDARLRRESVKKSFPSRVQRHLYEVLLFNSNITSTLGEKDCLGSIFSAEYRYPFLDRRLVEFLIAIPEEQRWWMDRPKTILRRALRGILPEEVRERRDKAVFSVVFDREVRGRLATQVEALIRGSILERLGVVNREKLHQMFSDYLQGKDHHRCRNELSDFIGMEIWCQSVLNDTHEGGVV